MGILNLIRKIYFNQKSLTKNIFLKFVYVFINAGIGWNFNILTIRLDFILDVTISNLYPATFTVLKMTINP